MKKSVTTGILLILLYTTLLINCQEDFNYQQCLETLDNMYYQILSLDLYNHQDKRLALMFLHSAKGFN